ncbi:hypothetical protein PEBR_17174 [Penicillium brasilianum]|uniref:DUF7730 domain-containing protein n=1 Tax=Penicillium brasilianum TaxID=104259 RepID=A0A1S9RPD3_PENBI|nr:hypothetical protein PEBR_17174 [Penicillium brasilianum]
MGTEVPKYSSLLTIPLEIRNQIYDLILGGQVILFISTQGTQLRHCLCPAKDQKFHFIQYIDGDSSWSHCGSHRKAPATYKRLPLLLTCRQIYSEAANILWARNTVHLHAGTYPRFQILSHLKATLPSYAFNGIRSLEVSCLYGIHHGEQSLNKDWFDHWDGMWSVVKIMEGLLDLQVWVKLDRDVNIELEARLLQPLMKLRVRNFILEVTWPASEGSETLLMGAPFSLVRNNSPIPRKPELGMEIVNGGLL